MSFGWGTGPWGMFPWGGGFAPESAQLAEAVAVRENVVRAFFSAELEFTGLLGTNDAGDPSHYSVAPTPGTVGSDGLPARPVTAILAELVDDAGFPGTIVDLTLDRRLSPYPAAYDLTVHDLVTLASVLLTPVNAHAAFPGVQQPPPQLTVDQALPTRDFAHPDTLSGELDPLPSAGDPNVLGTIPVGSDGDYAVDAGVQNLKKRIFRRLTTTKSRFLHLGAGYGVGVQNFLKLLATAGVRQQIAADAQAQIAQEPGVKKVVVKMLFDPAVPELTRLVVLVRPTAGKPVRIDAPFVQL